jgi:hypothetical protein
MRRQALASAARLLNLSLVGRSAAPCVAEASRCAARAAGRIGAPASTSSPSPAGLALRLASSSARGLPCPPHGGSGGGGGGGSSSAPPSAAESTHPHDPAAEAAYHAAADDALHALLDGLEAWVDDTPGLADVDVEYSVSCACV